MLQELVEACSRKEKYRCKDELSHETQKGTNGQKGTNDEDRTSYKNSTILEKRDTQMIGMKAPSINNAGWIFGMISMFFPLGNLEAIDPALLSGGHMRTKE